MPHRFEKWFAHSIAAVLKPCPADETQLTQAVWLRSLGLVYLAAFGSFWFQITGLIGSHGISPAADYLASVRAGLGVKGFWAVPSVFWLEISDHALLAVCAVGCVCGISLIAGWFSRVAALVCFGLYLSIVVVGQPFTNFQWDALLLEAGFLALFAGTPLVSWAYRALLFRLMFESGVVKLSSHDPNWRNLHALRFHFMTQPLPTPLAYYAHQAPSWLLDGCTALMFATELAAPFLLFAPRPLRRIGGVLLIFLQLVIAATGNYAFFNLLTIALCVWAFDDTLFVRWGNLLRPRVYAVRNRWVKIAATAGLSTIIFFGLLQVIGIFRPSLDFQLEHATRWIAPFEIVNRYGLFAVMTTTRPEVIIEGSEDGQTWREYQFPFKPGDLRRGLRFVAPYQPRLDWQMWFAALGGYQENSWAGALFYRLLTNEPTVTKLLGPPPFAVPPHYLRALLYDYSFTTPGERAGTGDIWQRKLLGTWFGPVSLRTTPQ
jgi:lipase maturation factor 1